MRDSGLTPVAEALNARHQRFVSRLDSACEGSKAKELYYYPTPGALVGSVGAIQHTRGSRAKTMCWPDPEEEQAVKTTILEGDAAAKRAIELWAKRKKRKAGSGSWT